MKEKRKHKAPDLTEGTFWLRQSTASSTECTGLTPSAVLDEEESLAYGELYAIHPPQAPRK
ncbi:MAG: hypothetical protein IJB22_04680 [Clostridia bacterium]|nr:hypothetical protein [Clostridia bacterium]MBQ7114076.1 hypothetical protein [Clostridia bacterium]